MPVTQKQVTNEVRDRLNEEFEYGLSTKDVENVLDCLSVVVEEGMTARGGDGKVIVRGLGRFTLKKVPARKARPGRNPATGEEITISAKPASKKVRVTVDKSLRDAVEG